MLHLSKGPLRLSDFDFGMYTAIVLGFIYGTMSPCMILIFSIQLRNAAMNKLCGRQPQRPTQSGHTQEHSIMSRFNPTLTTNNNPSTLFSVTESAKRLVAKKEMSRAADTRREISDMVLREVHIGDLQQELQVNGKRTSGSTADDKSRRDPVRNGRESVFTIFDSTSQVHTKRPSGSIPDQVRSRSNSARHNKEALFTISDSTKKMKRKKKRADREKEKSLAGEISISRDEISSIVLSGVQIVDLEDENHS